LTATFQEICEKQLRLAKLVIRSYVRTVIGAHAYEQVTQTLSIDLSFTDFSHAAITTYRQTRV
jgi:hypothetical protein